MTGGALNLSGGRRLVSELDAHLADVDDLVEVDEGQGGTPMEVECTDQKWRKLVLLEYPLRPPERPYRTERASEVRVKPRVQRIEVDVPIDAINENYRDDGDQRLQDLTLRSSNVDLNTNHLVGVVKDGKLILVPLAKAVQMRPKMDFVGQAAATAVKVESARTAHTPSHRAGTVGAQHSKGSMEVVTVQVERHETKRQIEARYRSHAYLREQEESEPWSKLKVTSPLEEEAIAVRERWSNPPEDYDADESVGSSEAREERQRAYVRELCAKPADSDA
ncbi:subunit RPC5 of DNA-directed RNA polymerase III [Chloropicon primus]|uniref:Subunit RPC5 of DNA-directed RNA polymerase III n=1 Tax=Chloropicon primus TaxID=1764295 RepID=A0A5B8MKG9_9CHLO|nr:subunit RPC5 of DNA-directed RNA polymerase III [Chloropicon primus]UPQ99091.1 subunit RPC5 of DNA-directed RNA polymerase III [Chloropicon primus]|eukprot:QDZ19880.1 subunit RPC5 of DNA-directed RNA polymerase III [Chloropicon primus]